MGKKSTRMLQEDVIDICNKRNQRLVDEAARKVRIAERALKATQKIEKQLEKLRLKDASVKP